MILTDCASSAPIETHATAVRLEGGQCRVDVRLMRGLDVLRIDILAPEARTDAPVDITVT